MTCIFLSFYHHIKLYYIVKGLITQLKFPSISNRDIHGSNSPSPNYQKKLKKKKKYYLFPPWSY